MEGDADARPAAGVQATVGERLAQPGTAAAALVGLVLARALVFVVQGVGFVHDDWAMVGHRQILGVWETSSASLLDAPRPVQWLTFAAVFGIAGEHPLVLFALVTLLNVVAALLLWRVLLRFLTPPTALAVAAAWVLLPNHTTLTAWGATSYVVVGLILVLLGVLALAQGRWLLALVPLVLSVWAYELLAVPAVVATLLVPGPLLLRPPERAVRWWARGVLLAGIGLATLRSLLDPIYESTARLPDPQVAWWGHFASGLLGTTDVPGWRLLGLGFTVGVLVALAFWFGGDRGRERGPTLVLVGLCVLALGLGAGFAIPLGTHGMADRLHVVSSIGSALVVVGLLLLLRSWRPVLAQVGAVGIVLVCLVGTYVGARAWTRSAQDATDLAAAIDERAAAEGRSAADLRILVGPTPIQRDGVRALSGSELRWIVALRHGEGTGEVRMAQSSGEHGSLSSDFDVVLTWDEVTEVDGADPGLPPR